MVPISLRIKASVNLFYRPVKMRYDKISLNFLKRVGPFQAYSLYKAERSAMIVKSLFHAQESNQQPCIGALGDINCTI